MHAFIKKFDKATVELPLVHICSIQDLDEYLNQGKIIPRFCNIIKKNLVYLSLGKPYFRIFNRYTKRAWPLFPIALILKKNCVKNFYHIYPFDSGSFLLNMHPIKKESDMILTHFSLKNLSDAYRLISAFFGNTAQYLFNLPLETSISNESKEVAYYYKLIRKVSRKLKGPHESISSIEIATQIPIKTNQVLGIVMPAHLILRENIKKFLKKHPNICFKLYLTTNGMAVEEMHGALYNETMRIYKDLHLVDTYVQKSLYSDISNAVLEIKEHRKRK